MKRFDLDFTKKILNNITDLSSMAGKDLYFHLKSFEDLGLTKYKKRNYKNWNYWWCEVDALKQKPNPNIFTADLIAFAITFKGYKFLKLLSSGEFNCFSNIFREVENWMETSNKEYYFELIDFKNKKFKQLEPQQLELFDLDFTKKIASKRG